MTNQLDRKTLEDLIQNHSIRDIERITGSACISYYLKKWEIQVPQNRKHKIYTPIDLEVLRTEAESGMYAKDIANKHGWSFNSVYSAYHKYGITPNKSLLDTEPTSEQKQIILGSLLGDGSIRPSGIFVMGQGKEQQEYLKWKVDLMSPFMSTIKLRSSLDKRTGKMDEGYYSYSHTHAYFKELRKLFYPDHKKIFPELEKLSPLSLAIWYMDDGHFEKSNGWSFLCTEGFTEIENHKIAYFFLWHYEIETRVHKSGKDTFRIGMNKKSSKKFFDIISPYMFSEMRYKIG